MMWRVGLNRTIRVGSLLTLFLFAMSASISVTLDHWERSPAQSQLAVFGAGSRDVAVFRGDWAQLQAADASLPRPLYVHRARLTVVQREYRLL